jgi:hypothetical protein
MPELEQLAAAALPLPEPGEELVELLHAAIPAVTATMATADRIRRIFHLTPGSRRPLFDPRSGQLKR